MEGSIKELALYRLEQAKEDLKVSKVMLENNMFKASLNRSYYSIFHAIRSVNIVKGFDSSKHSGVIAYFNQNFVKEGIFDKSVSKIIKSASRLREKSDYEDFYIASRKEVVAQLSEADDVIELVEVYLKNELE